VESIFAPPARLCSETENAKRTALLRNAHADILGSFERSNLKRGQVVDWLDEIGGMEESGSFLCAHCGEQNVIPLEVSGERVQTYVEDCQVCCKPNYLVVRWSRNRRKVRIEASPEN
jgi:hypothetical protein